MTQQPLPPPGNNVPFAPDSGSFRRSRGSVSPTVGAYTSWFARVLAWIIDSIPVIALCGIGFGLLVGTRETACFTGSSEFDLGNYCSTGASTLGQLSIAFAGLTGLAYYVWNYGYRQGTTGSSIGKSIMKFKVVHRNTARPMGFGPSVLRQLAHLVDAIACYVGFLWPIWDAKRQTFADKMMRSVCVPIA